LCLNVLHCLKFSTLELHLFSSRTAQKSIDLHILCRAAR